MERVTDVRGIFSDIEGARDVRSAVNDARSAMRSRTPDREAARAAIAEAITLFEADMAWRQRAKQELLPQLMAYNDAIKDTIGLRGQPALPREQALYVAACNSSHRDVSLSF